MTKYRVTTTVALSVVLGLFLGLVLTAQLQAQQGKAKRKQQAKRQAVERAKQKTEAMKGQRQDGPPRIRIGDEPGFILIPRMRIGDEHGIQVGPLNTQPNPCTWSEFDRNDVEDYYDQAADRVHTFWNMVCSQGNSSACYYSYKVMLARGSYSLYNLPTSWIYVGCKSGVFACSETDNNHDIYLDGVKADDGVGQYTMYVVIYGAQGCDGGNGNVIQMDCVNFTAL